MTKLSVNNSIHLYMCECICVSVSVCKRANIGNSVWGFISRGRIEIRYWPDTTMCKQINNIIADWILPCKQKLWIRIKLIHTPKHTLSMT